MDEKDVRKYIKDNIITKNGSLNKNMNRTDKHKHIFDYLNSLYKNGCIKEKLYLFYNNTTPHKCECGAYTKFISFTKGYRQFCSAKCRANSSTFKNNIKQTNLERYGVENPMQSEEIKLKVKQTNLERYGVNHNFKREDIKNKKIKTFINKYGVENPMQSEEIKLKVKQTNSERYGTEYPFQSEKIKQKIICKNRLNFYNKLLKTDRLKDIIPLFDIKDFNGVDKYYRFKCSICNTEFKSNLDDGKIPRCFVCNPRINRTSNLEKEVVDFIKSLNINNIIENDKTILNGKELDIYLPDYKLAIEFNGLYWHSDKFKNKNYHLNKTEECENKDIQILHIFEDEWIDKQEIIKNIIKVKLGLIKTKIYARKCVIKELKSKECKNFLNDNHLQGYIPAKINIGLYCENKLISLLTFGKSRYNKKYNWEILRYVNELDVSVIGGFAKLLKHFLRNYEGSIITYSDRRLFNGSIYRNNGFNELKKTKSNYYYVNHSIRVNRQNFQKHKLKDKLEIFDPNLTEWENMQLNGWDRIWDCGNYKFELL